MAINPMSEIVEFALDYMKVHGRVDWANELRPIIEERFGTSIRDHYVEMAYETIRRRIKGRLKKHDDSAVQQTRLKGFEVPTGIAIPTEGGGVVFVSTLAATRVDALAHRQILERNIVNAVHNRDEWNRTLDRLQPAWAINPDWTVGECIDFLAQ